MDLKFDNQVVVVTGASKGIGKEYALYFGLNGAKVVVNNRAQVGSENMKQVDQIVETIRNKGGIAIANYNDVIEGDKIVQAAIQTFGRIDILINNAAIIKDSIFAKMKDNDWNDVLNVSLTGTYKCCKAAWNQMVKQSYGRIINVASGSGFYGQLGQANYATAKAAIVGLSMTLAKEGQSMNIYTNVVAPVAASRMTETIMPEDVLAGIGPANIVPLIAILSHQSSSQNGSIYECSAGYMSRLRYQRSQGVLLDTPMSINDISNNWDAINSFDNENEYPNDSQDILIKVNENIQRMQQLNMAKL